MIFLHIRRGKMDLFIWLCGCLLAFLLPQAAKAEEGGKFDTFAARFNSSVTRRCYMEIRQIFEKRNIFPTHLPNTECIKYITAGCLGEKVVFSCQTKMRNECKE